MSGSDDRHTDPITIAEQTTGLTLLLTPAEATVIAHMRGDLHSSSVCRWCKEVAFLLSGNSAQVRAFLDPEGTTR